ncbi:GNAT family N-acetyltransferase [Paenibacillus campi]|uniref:GNAT family N-acetyltransferase n=1 Tax=Paenibacillus campi TaxID=3106031 RepID=UPI002AFF9511|nr:GNAT family N-acetyltransferase [Paenibacillus sp. SGZ-1009]
MSIEHKPIPAGQLSIRRAVLGEEALIIALLVEAADWMEEQGIGQWRRALFTPALIGSYFAEREVYVAECAGELAGMFTLQAGDEEYWQHQNDKEYWYLHRLTVAHKFRGLAIGAYMLDQAVQMAAARGSKGLRLDCLAELVPLNRFYQRHDFRYMGTHNVNGKQANLYEKLPPARAYELRLEYFGERDFDTLLRWTDEQDAQMLMQWSGPVWRYPLQRYDLEQYIVGANDPSRSDWLIYAVVERLSGQTMGHMALGRIDRQNRSARLSRVLVGDANARGKGYGRQMVMEGLRIGFEALGLHRITLAVFDYNEQAAGLYESCGFRKEGLHRDTALVDGTYYSVYEMAILEQEWAELTQRAAAKSEG